MGRGRTPAARPLRFEHDAQIIHPPAAQVRERRSGPLLQRLRKQRHRFHVATLARAGHQSPEPVQVHRLRIKLGGVAAPAPHEPGLRAGYRCA